MNDKKSVLLSQGKCDPVSSSTCSDIVMMLVVDWCYCQIQYNGGVQIAISCDCETVHADGHFELFGFIFSCCPHEFNSSRSLIIVNKE